MNDSYFEYANENKEENTDLRENSEIKITKIDMCKIKSHSFVQDKTSIISPLVKIYRNNKENVEKQEMKKNS